MFLPDIPPVSDSKCFFCDRAEALSLEDGITLAVIALVAVHSVLSVMFPFLVGRSVHGHVDVLLGRSQSRVFMCLVPNLPFHSPWAVQRRAWER